MQEKLKAEVGLTDADFFRHASDMYIGCDYNQLDKVMKICRANGSVPETFKPNKGSDMEKYQVGVDVPFQYMDELVARRKNGDLSVI